MSLCLICPKIPPRLNYGKTLHGAVSVCLFFGGLLDLILVKGHSSTSPPPPPPPKKKEIIKTQQTTKQPAKDSSLGMQSQGVSYSLPLCLFVFELKNISIFSKNSYCGISIMKYQIKISFLSTFQFCPK